MVQVVFSCVNVLSKRRLVMEFVQVTRIGFICGPNSSFSELHKSRAGISHPAAVDRLCQPVVNCLADSVHQAICTEWARFGNRTLEMEHVWGHLPLLERSTQMQRSAQCIRGAVHNHRGWRGTSTSRPTHTVLITQQLSILKIVTTLPFLESRIFYC